LLEPLLAKRRFIHVGLFVALIVSVNGVSSHGRRVECWIEKRGHEKDGWTDSFNLHLLSIPLARITQDPSDDPMRTDPTATSMPFKCLVRVAPSVLVPFCAVKSKF